MALVAGVDGCRGGWICVRRDLNTGAITSDVYETAATLISQTPTPLFLAVDIPIGLSDDGSRECDCLARKRLGPPRASSVFPAPVRPVLGAVVDGVAKWEAALEISRRHCGRGISKQTCAIVGKIAEVDVLMTADPSLQDRVREIHPEVSFWAWNNERPMQSNKKTPAGQRERRTLVDACFGTEAFDRVRARDPVKKVVGNDDILDAFAALWTAERIFRGQATTLQINPRWIRTGYGWRSCTD